jgi:hypothetical protein
LLHESDVAAHEMADVIYFSLHHNQPVESHAESEGGPPVGINITRPENIGVHKAASKELNPS